MISGVIYASERWRGEDNQKQTTRKLHVSRVVEWLKSYQGYPPSLWRDLRRLRTAAPTPARPVHSRNSVVGSGTVLIVPLKWAMASGPPSLKVTVPVAIRVIRRKDRFCAVRETPSFLKRRACQIQLQQA